MIKRPQIQPQLFPRRKMVRRSHRPSDFLRRTNAPKLLERRRAHDGRSISLSGLVDVVGAAVGGDLAFVVQACCWVVGIVGFDGCWGEGERV